MSAATNPPLSASFYNNANNPLANGNNNNSGVAKNSGRPSSKKNVLRPVAVRERCKSIQGCKELKNKDPFSTTISFLMLPTQTAEGEESQTEKENAKLPLRISIFCDTGTIATAKVIDGQVRHSFRRNVTSLDVMERLVRNSEGPVEINDQLIGVTDTDDDQEEITAGGLPNYKKGVELADVGLCILEGEREKLAKHLRHIDDEAEKEAAEVQEQQAKQLQLQKEQGASKQKQQQQQQQQQPSKQQVQQQQQQQQQAKQTAKQPDGEKQAQMLHKAMKGGSNQKDSGSNSNRIGRRRNKLNNLRKNRNLNNSKKPILSQSGHDMNKTKRRGGKQGGAADSKRSSSGGKKQARSARLTGKSTNAAGLSDGPAARNNFDDNDESSGPDSSSVMSSPEQVATNSIHTEAFKNCGYEFHFKLPAEVMNQVDQCLRDIAKMNKVVKAVATNGRGTVFLYGNGGVAYTPAIPKALYQKLRQLRSSSFSSRPSFVALGTRDRYYVSFNDGSADWKGSSSLDKMLKKRVTKRSANSSSQAEGNAGDGGALLPRSVAFGATYDTFFVVFNDGSWEYQGRSVPKSLEKKLRERDDAADLVICNLGPNGEWFIKAENGKMWWSGITPELDMVLKKITKTGFLHNMDFGENGSYFVSYDEE